MLRLKQGGLVLAVIGVLGSGCEPEDADTSAASAQGGSAYVPGGGAGAGTTVLTNESRGGASVALSNESRGGASVALSNESRGGASVALGSSASGGTSQGASSSDRGGAGGAVSGRGGTTQNGGGGSSSTGDCPEHGNVTYTLGRTAAPTPQEQAAYDKITTAMDEAVRYYNCYTDIEKTLKISFVPSVDTADGNINGSIRFGSTASMNRVTAMHEIAHTVGVGTAPNWSNFVVNSRFTGANALAELKSIPSHTTEAIGADRIHFWPYGLNYESEGKAEADLIAHCRMVMAIRRDLGLK